jgi:alginate O-acetyltransferase complex protein AlgJ
MEPSTTPTDRVRPVAEWVLIAGFLVAIGLPMADGVFGLDPSPTWVEIAPASGFPKLQRTFPRRRDLSRALVEVRDYTRHGFGFRVALMRLHNLVQYRWLGRTGSPGVVLGRDGWLFFADQGNLDDYRSTRRFSREELEQWGRVLVARREWCRARGIRYLFVLAPSTHAIYPEFLPENLVSLREESRLDQLASYLAGQTDLEFLDPRPALRAAKAEGRLYHRTDTHWNERGAFVAYRAIVGRLRDWFPRMRPLEPTEVEESTVESPGGDLAGMLALRDVYREEEVRVVPRRPRRAHDPDGSPLRYETIVVKIHPLVISEVDDPRLPRAVMFRDSYASSLIPLLSEHFRRVVYAWKIDAAGFDLSLIERERPDVVIDEIVDRLTLGRPSNPASMTPGSGVERQDSRRRGLTADDADERR